MLERIRLFYGLDPREAVGAHVFLQSVLERCSLPVEAIALTSLVGDRLNIKSDGTNSFSKLRFAVPFLSEFNGWAIFADGVDMLCRTDLAELWAFKDCHKAVQIVQHDYQTRQPTKYIGTELEAKNEDYERKNWSSLVIWNCGYYPHRKLTPKFIAETPGDYLHRFSWIEPDRIGELPKEWNHLVGEYDENPNTKLAHFTAGIPGFTHYRSCEFAKEWQDELKRAMRGIQ